MTCIAYDGATIAADSQRGLDGDMVIPVDVTKLHRMRLHGRSFIVGLAGDHGLREELFLRFVDGKTGPNINAHLLVVELLGSGHRCHIVADNGQATDVTGKPIAIGSGRDLAMGAMLAGAEARAAVRIAASRCTTVGGRVRSMVLAEAGGTTGARR